MIARLFASHSQPRSVFPAKSDTQPSSYPQNSHLSTAAAPIVGEFPAVCLNLHPSRGPILVSPPRKPVSRGSKAAENPSSGVFSRGFPAFLGVWRGDCWGPRGSVCLVFRGDWGSVGRGGRGRMGAWGTGWAGGEGYRWDGVGGVREGMGNPLRRAGPRANPHTRASVLRNPDLSREPGFPIFLWSPGNPPSVHQVSAGMPRETGNQGVPGDSLVARWSAGIVVSLGGTRGYGWERSTSPPPSLPSYSYPPKSTFCSRYRTNVVLYRQG